MTEANKYPASVFWSDEDAGFIAIALDLPGCSAFGKTRVKALDELQEAIDAWIEAARSVGNPIPKPSSVPEVEHYSGKLLLRIPRELHAKLTATAKQQGVSLNQHLLYLLATASARSDTISGAKVVVVAHHGEGGSTVSGTQGIDLSNTEFAPPGSTTRH